MNPLASHTYTFEDSLFQKALFNDAPLHLIHTFVSGCVSSAFHIFLPRQTKCSKGWGEKKSIEQRKNALHNEISQRSLHFHSRFALIVFIEISTPSTSTKHNASSCFVSREKNYHISQWRKKLLIVLATKMKNKPPHIYFASYLLCRKFRDFLRNFSFFFYCWALTNEGFEEQEWLTAKFIIQNSLRLYF